MVFLLINVVCIGQALHRRSQSTFIFHVYVTVYTEFLQLVQLMTSCSCCV